MKRIGIVTILAVCLIFLVGPGRTRTAAAQAGGSDSTAASTGNQAVAALSALAFHAREGVEAANENDAAAMQRESIELHATWDAVEDSVRTVDPALCGEIEAALHLGF